MEKKITLITLTLLATAFIAASVFTYYPLTLTVQPTAPPVVFATGSNANQQDLSGNIVVNIGQNSTSASITIHPTYHTTYYKNVTLIKNTDSKAYNVSLVLDDITGDLPSGSHVYLIVYSSGATRDLRTGVSGYPDLGPTGGVVTVVNLTAPSTNSPLNIGVLDKGGTWEIDFLVYIPEGNYAIETYSQTFSMHIVYTPGNEMPP